MVGCAGCQSGQARFVVERKFYYYGSASSLAFSADGKRLAAVGASGAVIMRDIESGRDLWRTTDKSPLAVSLAASPDGKYLAVGRDHGSVDILDISNGAVIATSGAGDRDLRLRFDVAFAPDGKLVASGSSCPSPSRPDSRYGTRLWDAMKAREVRELADPDHVGGVLAIVYGRDGRWLATSGWDKTIHVFDVTTGALKQTVETPDALAYGLAVRPDGAVLAAAMDTGNIDLYDVTGWRLLRKLALTAKPAFDVAFSPQGDLLLSTANEPVIRLWSTESWRPVGELRGHDAAVATLAFSRDGRRLASAGADQNIILWRREQ